MWQICGHWSFSIWFTKNVQVKRNVVSSFLLFFPTIFKVSILPKFPVYINSCWHYFSSPWVWDSLLLSVYQVPVISKSYPCYQGEWLLLFFQCLTFWLGVVFPCFIKKLKPSDAISLSFLTCYLELRHSFRLFSKGDIFLLCF